MTIHRIVNAESGEVIVREYTPEELEELHSNIEKAKKLIAEEEAKAAARQAILDRLGLTEDEARLLLG